MGFQRASRILAFLLIVLSTKEEGSDADAWIEEGNQRNDQVALEHPLAPLTYQQEAQALITEMMDFAQALELPHPPFWISSQKYWLNQKEPSRDVFSQQVKQPVKRRQQHCWDKSIIKLLGKNRIN